MPVGRHGNDRGRSWAEQVDTTREIARATTDEGNSTAEVVHARLYTWDAGGGTWVKGTGTGGGGGGGDGAILDGVSSSIRATVKDYANSNPLTAVLVDTNGDPYTAGGSSGLTDAQLRASPVPVGGGAGVVHVDDNGSTLSVDDGGGSLTVDGTFWQVTQPVSIAATVNVDNTEIETPAALADAQANPTLPRMGALASIWNPGSSQWDRMRQPLTDTQLRATPVPVSGTVTANAGTGPFPVSDNAGSLTVDAPVGTPVAVRLSDGAAFYDGAKTGQLPSALVGGRLDVNIGAPATLPVSLATNTPDVTDRAAREVGRVRIWDGTDEVTVVPLRTQPATTEKVIPTFEIPNRLATYAVTTAEIAPAITIGVKELLALWYTGGTKDIYIVDIWVSTIVTTASTAGRSTIRVSTITSAPTGGTELTKVDIAGGGTSAITNTMAVKTGGGAIGTTFVRREWLFATQPLGKVSEQIFTASNPGNGIILRGGSSSGISIDIERVVAHTALVDQMTVGVRWIEV